MVFCVLLMTATKLSLKHVGARVLYGNATWHFIRNSSLYSAMGVHDKLGA